MRFETFIGRRHLVRAKTTAREAVPRVAAAVALVALLLAGAWIALEWAYSWHPSLALGRTVHALVLAVAGYLLLIFLVGLALRLRLTSLIAILSITVGVVALVVVIAVIDGLDATFHRKYMALVAHVEALPPEVAPDELFSEPASVEAALRADPRVLALAPQVRREAFLTTDRDFAGRQAPVQLLGLDPAQMREVAGFVDRITLGTGNPGPQEIVLGQLLAQQGLLVQPGDTVWAITRLAIDAHGPHLRWVPLRVAGLFVTGIPEIDFNTAYVSLDTARRIFVLPPDATSAFLIRTRDPYRARAAARQIGAALGGSGGPAVRLRSWDETNQEFFHALRLEKIGTFVMLLMIVLVASFNIIGTLVMIVTERTREIGILKTVGASDPLIHRTFLRSGLLIGLLGTALGLGGGLGLIWLVGHALPIRLPVMLYDLDRLPVLIHWPTVALVSLASVLICLGASVLPARTAARLDPVDALRRE